VRAAFFLGTDVIARKSEVLGMESAAVKVKIKRILKALNPQWKRYLP
jgi:hypothetical protein